MAVCAGCVTKAPAAPVAPPDPPARLTRPQTPDELFGAPRPKLPEAVVKVLDALWARQLRVHRLEVRMQTEELDEAGNPRADKRPLTRYVAWDERYGYRLFTSGEGFICDGKEHTDLSLGRKTPCPEGGFHAKVAPIFEAEPLEASRLEAVVRIPKAKVYAFVIVDHRPPDASGSVSSQAVEPPQHVKMTNGSAEGHTEIEITFDPERGYPTDAWQSDYLYAVSRSRPVRVQAISGENWIEKAPGLWVAGVLNTEQTEYDPVSRKDVTTHFRQTLVDFVVNGPSSPALFLPVTQPGQPSSPTRP